mmetsp:Transcript_3458/g.7176  ORF Transcript_3458/g.7176 Transcript_3458/m.7176 type:complete len:217 (-) Transcript_3458:898-1548(-)
MCFGKLAHEAVGFSDDFKASNQTFVLVEKDSDFDGMEADGLLGLGFNVLSRGNPTLIETLKEQGLIEKSVFAIYLNDDNYGRSIFNNPASAITIGEYDLETYASDASEDSVHYLKVYKETGYWSVLNTEISIKSVKIFSGRQMAILDTGTSLIYGPSSQVLSIFAYFKKEHDCQEQGGMLTCRCATVDDFPDIVFSLENKDFKVPPKKYFYQVSST